MAGKEYHKSQAVARRGRVHRGPRSPPGGQVGQPNVRFQQHFFYGVYYTSQAMFQIGGDYWKWYRHLPALAAAAPGRAPAAARAGCGTGCPDDDHQAGVNYSTAMAVLALTVEYRFLPIYQRGEEPDERAK